MPPPYPLSWNKQMIDQAQQNAERKRRKRFSKKSLARVRLIFVSFLFFPTGLGVDSHLHVVSYMSLEEFHV